MSHKYPAPELTEERKAKILEGQTEQKQLGLKAHWALCDLARFFEKRKDQRFYKVNGLICQSQDIWQRHDVSAGV